ncbi:hypothetical protein HYX13_05705 [Candidatus Woesearchaeota archaeon]|nr:hypothetical protein [Candidatus Woesearchaeota archaeon]
MTQQENEYLLDAREELKRLEHIIYVTLKYTRTVDVLVNAVQRLISIYDLVIEALMEQAKEQGKITSLPKSPALRATQLGQLSLEDAELQKYLQFYTFLKTVLNKPHKKREEFRRHVTLVVELEKSTAEIDIDNLMNCEKFVHKFFRYAWKKIIGGLDEDS